MILALERYLVFALFAFLFLPTVYGMVEFFIGHTFAYKMKVVVQLVLYLPMGYFLFKLWDYEYYKKMILLFVGFVLFLLIFSLPKNLNEVATFMHGLKVYLVPIVYMYVVKFLIDNSVGFKERFVKYIVAIFWLAFSVTIFEVFSMEFSNTLHEYFINISPVIDPQIYGRPNGIFLDIHSGPFLLAIGFFYLLVHHKYFFASSFMIAVILTNVKAWIIALNIVMFIYLLRNFKKFAIKFLIFIAIEVVIVILFGLSDTITAQFETQREKKISTQIMIDLYLEKENYNHPVLPKGFDFSPTYLSDSYILWLTSQIGFIGVVLYLFLIYGNFKFTSSYWAIVLFCSFSLIHTNPVLYIPVSIILGYFIFWEKSNCVCKRVTSVHK